MEDNCNTPGNSLNVEYIQKKFDEGLVYTKEAKGRDLVLVIGNTGVGKSTTCNYLAGKKMRQVTRNGSPAIETVHETNAKIGHDVKAETLYAQTVLMDPILSLEHEGSKSDICLLDCPGFLCNRSVEDGVIESISTEMAVRYARQIKGILILISFYSIRESRMTEFRELIKILTSLFKNPIEMIQYSLFIITKKDEYTPENVAKDITVGKLGAVKLFYETQANLFYENQNMESSEGLTYTDYNIIATYFSVLLERENSIIFINPLDEGESRDLILTSIIDIKPRIVYLEKAAGMNASQAQVKQLNPITIEDFNFSEYEENRIKFNKMLYDRAHYGNLLISKIQEYAKDTLKLCTERKDHERRLLLLLEESMINLEEEICKIDEAGTEHLLEDFERVQNIETVIRKNDEFIMSHENRVRELTNQIENLNEEERGINTDEPLIFRVKTINQNVNPWKIFGWVRMIFNANTGDPRIPIINVKKVIKNGEWVNEDDRRDKGIYKIEYHSNYGANPARASVITYIKTRDEPGNKLRIKNIRKEIDQLQDEIIRLQNRIEFIQNQNTILLTTIEQARREKENYKHNLNKKLEECKNDIAHYTCFIEDGKEAKDKLKLPGIKYLTEFRDNISKFDVVESISDVLDFPSSIIKQFVSQYKKCLYNTCIYENIFCETDIQSAWGFEKEAKDSKNPLSEEKL